MYELPLNLSSILKCNSKVYDPYFIGDPYHTIIICKYTYQIPLESRAIFLVLINEEMIVAVVRAI